MTEQLDQLTVFKASELRKQGYKDVGFVLQNEYGQIGVVAHAAVRWLHTPDEFFAFMHPDESQPRITGPLIDAMVANADKGYEAQLSAALAAQAQQESKIVYLWRQRNHDGDNAWIDGSKELHGWMSKDKKYETRVLYEKPAPEGEKE